MYDQFATSIVEHAKQRPLARLTRRRDAQVDTSLGPGMSQIRMGQRFRFVAEQQHDVARFGLLTQQAQPQSRPVDRLGILSAVQAMAGAPPTEPVDRSYTPPRIVCCECVPRVAASQATREA